MHWLEIDANAVESASLISIAQCSTGSHMPIRSMAARSSRRQAAALEGPLEYALTNEGCDPASAVRRVVVLERARHANHDVAAAVDVDGGAVGLEDGHAGT